MIRSIMPRSRLLNCLDDPELTPANRFVLLYTYFEQLGTVDAENRLRDRKGHPLRLKPCWPDPGQAVLAVQELRKVTDAAAFDLMALSWLKGLDSHLGQKRPLHLDSGVVFKGFDAREYELRRQNRLFSKIPTSKEYHSGSLAAYVKFLKPVPVKIKGRHICSRSEASWGDTFFHRRLARISKDRKLTVLLWPLQGRLQTEKVPGSYGAWIRVRGTCDPEEEVKAALAASREQEATILIFPELTLTECGEETLRSELRGNGPEGFPLLTLAGRGHRKRPGKSDVNEALLLDPEGQDLLQHRKLTAYTDRRDGIAERIKVGKRLTVLESQIGNIVPLICLDLLSTEICALVEHSHGNLLLVPSLSETTKTHCHAAKRLQTSNLAATFVCNRRFNYPRCNEERQKGTSFYRIPRIREPRVVTHYPDQADKPYLLFRF